MEIRRQISEVLEEIGRLNPSMRFGQLVVNISYMARGWTKSAPWDVEDEEFLKAATSYLENLRRVGRGSPTAQAVERDGRGVSGRWGESMFDAYPIRFPKWRTCCDMQSSVQANGWETILLPRNLAPKVDMGLAKGAYKNRAGYTCPVCRRKRLAANEMATAWSAEGYVPACCLECQAKACRSYPASLDKNVEQPSA